MRSGLVCLLMVAAAARASEAPGDEVNFVAPDGFAGHAWGEVRAAFHRLPAEPVSVGAAWMRIQEKQTGYSCQLTTWIPKYIESAFQLFTPLLDESERNRTALGRMRRSRPAVISRARSRPMSCGLNAIDEHRRN